MIRGKPDMQESVVLVADIPGFQGMIRGAAGDVALNELLARIHRVLRTNRGFIDTRGLDRPTYAFKAFTDNIVLAWPPRHPGDDGEGRVGRTLMMTGMFQASLALEGFFIRGGLAFGPHFMDEFIVFGPALIEAHDTETARAIFPRVVLANSTIERVRKHLEYYASVRGSPHETHLLVAPDGEWFINYLEIARVDDALVGEHLELLDDHRRIVAEKVETHRDPRVREKYSWVASYHNYLCRDLYPEEPQLLLAGAEFPEPSGFKRLSEQGWVPPSRR